MIPVFQEANAMMSSDDCNPHGPVRDASRVGAELRAARLRLGWALPDVAVKLRIRLCFLEAIEDGRVADLPGNAYAVGFLRAYATALGLDAGEVARRFRAEAHAVNRKTELAFPAPVPDRGVPAGAVVLLGALLMAGAYAGWYRFSGDVQPSSEVVAPVPDRLAPLADRVAPDPPSPAAVVSPSPSTSALAAPAPNPPPPSLPTSESPSAAVAPTPVSPAPAENRVVLRLKSDAWIQVKERQGQVLLNRVMRAGDTWTVPKGTQLVLSTGNAGGTELLLDGQAMPALGAFGSVRRDVMLDPDALKAASTARPPPQ
jgi:cytoskeleton protein RodZ